MKLLAGLLLALFVLPTWAAEKITAVTVDDVSYVNIQDAHIVSGGRVALIYPAGGGTVPTDKLPKAFLDSWGITQAEVTASRAGAQRQKELELTQAVRGGLFREVEGVVYDLRKPQSTWVRLSGAKILTITPEGALAALGSGAPNPTIIVIRDLPGIYADNDIVSIFAKATGPFSFATHVGERTVRGYDAGRACARDEIPPGILQDGLAFAAQPNAPHPAKTHHGFPSLPGESRLHAIGSSFFVSKDGYLVTNHHVVKDATKIEIDYRGQTFLAKVVADDETNDLAVLKVQGGTFEPLSISLRETEDLGEEVFTIGFPNIQMQGIEPKYTDGKISSLKGMQDDPGEYQISVPVQPGNSGGPLCDAHGQAVGIVVARLNDMAMLETSGVVPQNVNYAVKASSAVRLLRTINGLVLPSQGVRADNSVKIVENAIAMVKIY